MLAIWMLVAAIFVLAAAILIVALCVAAATADRHASSQSDAEIRENVGPDVPRLYVWPVNGNMRERQP